MTEFAYTTTPAKDVKADVLVLPIFEGPEDGPGVREVGLAGAFGAAKLKGERGDTLFVQRRSGDRFAAAAVLLVGAGPRAKASPDAVRRAIGRVAAQVARFRTVATTFGQAARPTNDSIQSAIEGALLGSYRFDRYKSGGNERPVLERVTVLGRAGSDARSARRAIERGEVVADAVAWARDLVNTPAGECTPDYLAKQAQSMAREVGLEVKVWNEKQLEQGGFGGIIGVGQGSVNPPRLIELRYRGAAPSRKPIALTGKGIAFDSGGLSIKDAKSMETMKDDMAGAASIVATMKAIARLRPRVNVIAAVPSAETLPSGSAVKPGDILRHRGGKTSEVLNTDAEGRLVLADALAFLAEQEPRVIVDTATLTGACMVALGNDIWGVMGNDRALIRDLLASGRTAGEPGWELPLWDGYKPEIESAVADMKNVGNRWGGAITAALFLAEFVGDTPWAHLDIAGPAFSDKASDLGPRGGTGVPVRTLVDYVLSQAKR